MRRAVWLWTIVLGCLPFAAPAQAPPGFLNTPLDNLLIRWSQQTKNVKALYAQFNRTIEDVVWKQKDVAWGSARYLAPDQQPSMARLDIIGPEPTPDNPNAADPRESFIVNGRGEIWQLEVQRKIARIWDLGPNAQQPLGADGPLPFLFGNDPLKTKQRYTLKLVQETDTSAHVHVEPKLPADAKEFASAELYLDTVRMVPIALVFQQPNGNKITYEFDGPWGPPGKGEQQRCGIWTDVQNGLTVDPSDFATSVPQGWQQIQQQVNQQPQPAVMPAGGAQ